MPRLKYQRHKSIEKQHKMLIQHWSGETNKHDEVCTTAQPNTMEISSQDTFFRYPLPLNVLIGKAPPFQSSLRHILSQRQSGTVQSPVTITQIVPKLPLRLFPVSPVMISIAWAVLRPSQDASSKFPFLCFTHSLSSTSLLSLPFLVRPPRLIKLRKQYRRLRLPSPLLLHTYRAFPTRGCLFLCAPINVHVIY